MGGSEALVNWGTVEAASAPLVRRPGLALLFSFLPFCRSDPAVRQSVQAAEGLCLGRH